MELDGKRVNVQVQTDMIGTLTQYRLSVEEEMTIVLVCDLPHLEDTVVEMTTDLLAEAQIVTIEDVRDRPLVEMVRTGIEVQDVQIPMMKQVYPS